MEALQSFHPVLSLVVLLIRMIPVTYLRWYPRTRENGILNGNTTYAADGLCTLTNLERSTETHAGDQVITTGLGGVFPPDLLVGTVQDVVPETSGKSSIAVVRPGADPRTAKHVFIVTAY